jgi:hypothetical protein
MKYPTLQELQANSDSKLWNTQEHYERVCKERINARTEMVNAIISYETAYNAEVSRLNKEDGKMAISLMKEEAKSRNIELYGEMLKAINAKKGKDVEMKYLEQRINQIKAIVKMNISNYN